MVLPFLVWNAIVVSGVLNQSVGSLLLLGALLGVLLLVLLLMGCS